MKLRVLLLAAVVALAAFAVPAMAQQSTFVDPELVTQIKERNSANMLIHMNERADLSEAFGMSWEDRGQYVYDELTAFSKHSQEKVRALLDSLGADYQSFWISNAIVVKQADLETLTALSKNSDIAGLYLEPVFHVPPLNLDANEAGNEESISAVATHLDQINAPDAWAAGYTGQEVVIGVSDSGMIHTHEALVNQYRGNTGNGFDHNFNWFSPASGAQEPNDPHGHGTHVTGSVVGDNGADEQIGVAPNAQWIGCQACDASGSCPGAATMACAEFHLAPHDLNGENANPAMRPAAVNNSLGSCASSYDPYFQDAIDAWIAAGIIPVYANGNSINCGYPSPPGRNTVGNPGRYGSVLGIGSSGNNNGQYAPHSNWGPTDNPNDGSNPELPDPMGYPDLKPNVVAPGVNIRSSVPGSNSSYGGNTGTSMSTPVATGVIALMLSAAPELLGDYHTIGTLLMQTANPIPYDSGGGEGPGLVPNYATGWGEVDALAATLAALEARGATGTLAGKVTDNASGLPIKDAVVTATDSEGDTTTGTDSSGEFAMNLAKGTYDIEFTAYGYQMVAENGVSIDDDQTTVLNASMVAAATHEVSGTVTDSITGWPLHAEIDIGGYPHGPIYTDPADGSYTVDLPEDMEFEFTVTAVAGGYDFAIEDVGPLNSDDVQDFELDADLDVCDAPGYDNSSSALLSESFDDTTTPSGWTVEDYDGGGGVWTFDNPGSRTNETGGDGNFAIVDSDFYGSGIDQDTGLITPSFDLSAVASAELQFAYDFRYVWDASAYVDVSIDGGSTWGTEWSVVDASDRGPATATVLLNDYVGEDDVQVRFHYVGAWDYWWQIDDVEVIAAGTCAPQPGELVYGVVSDANDSQPLNGATVEVDGTSFSTTTASNPDLGDGAYYLFVPEGSQDVIASLDGYGDAQESDTFVDGETRRLDLELTSGLLSVMPEELSATVTFGDSASKPMIVVNEGSPVSVELSVVAGLEEDFEDDFPPAGWTVENFGGDCVWMTNEDYGAPNYAGGDGLSATADANVCGLFALLDTALVSPEFPVDSSSELNFVLSYYHLGNDFLNVDITTDGGATWESLESWTSSVDNEGPGAAQSIPLGAYAGNTAQVRFHYFSDWGWWAQVDQVEITGDADWLSVTPDDGVVSDQTLLYQTLNTTVSFDAGAASITEPGTYMAAILVENDTPQGDIVVPVEMIVEPNSDQAGIVGTITSLGFCEDDPQPLAGASVEIIGASNSYTLTSDENGEYALWLDADESPVAVAVQAADHVDKTVVDVQLAGGATTTENIDLRLDAACPSVNPDSISASHEPNQTGSYDITLSNSGAADLNWNTDVAPALNFINSDGAGKTATGQASSPNSSALDVRSLYEGDVPTIAGYNRITAINCDTGDYLVVHDGDEIDNGYSANPDMVDIVSFVEYYEPAQYPALIGEVCVSFISLNSGAVDLPFELIVVADDGPGGAPGTELGSLSAVAQSVPGGGVPDDAVSWFTVDAASLDLVLESGGVYIGVRFDPGVPGDVFVASDESSAQQVGFWRPDDEWMELTASGYDNYKALFVRPQLMPNTGCVEPDAVDWLSVSPGTGTTAAGGSSTITVDIDTASMLPGDYEADVCIFTDESRASIVSVPVSLTVDMPANYGIIEGHVDSLGYCSTDTQPAEGATVVAQGQSGSWTVSTDQNGDFVLAVDEDEAPLEVSVSHEGHFGATEAGVVVSAGQTTSLHFELELDASCAEATPDSLETTLDRGDSGTESLSLANHGAGDLEWSAFHSETAGSLIFGGSGGSEGYGVAASHPDAAADIRSNPLYQGVMPTLETFSGVNNTFDCDNAPGLVIHDSGVIDNGYSANAAVVSEVSFVEYYEPDVYPAELGVVCVAFLSVNPAEVDQAFEMIVYADDGPNGAPGTELGAVTATAEDIPGGGIPPSVPWVTADLSSLGVSIASGGIYVGVRFDPAVPDSVFIASDESSAQQTGYWRPVSDAGDAWEQLGVDAYEAYRALMIRPQMQPEPGCMNPESVPWLSVSPDNGTVVPAGSVDIDVTADTTNLLPGQYAAMVCIESNDPQTPMLEIPFELTVEPTADDAGLSGTITGLGYCDSNPQPLAGAEITIESANDSYTLTSDENGEYSLWMDIGESPVNITVEAVDHVDVEISGVALTAGGVVVEDIDLRLDAACPDVNPDSINASQEPDKTSSHTITLSNTGAADLGWEADVTTSALTFIDSDGAGRTATARTAVHADAASDMRSLYKGGPPTIAGFKSAAAIDCDTGDYLVIHDSGEIDNGYSANPDNVDIVSFVEYYEPAQYPALIGEVCVSFISVNPEPVDQAFELIVVADDGPGGAPGTELGSVSAVAQGIPGEGLPASVPWFTVDVADLGLVLESGGVYIGVRFDPGMPGGVYIASDETSAQQVGFWKPDNEWMELTASGYDDYKALFARPQMISLGCDNPQDVSWLSVSPASGVAPAGGSSTITVDVDTAGMQPGEYQADVCIITDESNAQYISVPVNVTVEVPDTWGVVEGQVDSLGHCSSNSEPAAGAEVVIADKSTTWTTVTDESGYFSMYIDSAEAPVDVSVSFDGHFPASQNGVNVDAGEATTLSFELELDAGCADVSPASFSLTLGPNDGTAHTDELVISNSGAAELGWGLYSSTDGCESPEPADWLSVDPDEGTTDAGDSAEVDVNVDAEGLEPGVYEALICLVSDDLENPLIEIPYLLEVLGDGIFHDRFEQ